MKKVALLIPLLLIGCAKLEVENQYGKVKFTGNLGSMTSTIRERADTQRIPLFSTAQSDLLLDVKEPEFSEPSITLGPEGFVMTGIVDNATKADVQGHWLSRVVDRVGNTVFWWKGFDTLENINSSDNMKEVNLNNSNNSAMTTEVLSGNATAVKINDSNNALQKTLAP